MLGMEECSDNGFVIQSARLTIVLVMALQCVFLQLRGYITILMLSDTQQGFQPIVTHNHLEGIKGAEATASAIFLARTGHGKTEIKEYMEYEFGYELNRTCDEISPDIFIQKPVWKLCRRPSQLSWREMIFEDVIRTAVSLGGDCDTLTAIAGGIAEGFYGVPVELKEECYKRLPEPLLKVLKAFMEYLERNAAVN